MMSVALLLGAAGALVGVVPLQGAAAAAPAEGDNLGGAGQLLADRQEASPSTQLELYQGQPEANQPFEAVGMLPGDRVSQSYQLQVSHQVPVEVGFRVEIQEQTQQLAEKLQVTVVCTTTGETVYQGTMDGAQSGTYVVELPQNSSGVDVLDYTVDVSVDTSLDNTYQGAQLRADFLWYATDDGALTPPQTGDDSHLMVWVAVAVVAAAALCVVLVRKGGKRA